MPSVPPRTPPLPAVRLCTSGVVRLHVNSWLEVSFCLPHKIHYAATSLIPPEAIERSLKAIRNWQVGRCCLQSKNTRFCVQFCLEMTTPGSPWALSALPGQAGRCAAVPDEGLGRAVGLGIMAGPGSRPPEALCLHGGTHWTSCSDQNFPYHALLLLSDEKSLLGELPIDCSPALVRVIKTTSAVKNLQQLAQDADLALLQVPWGLGETPWVGRMGSREGLDAPQLAPQAASRGPPSSRGLLHGLLW
eukprot:bmy_01854T0